MIIPKKLIHNITQIHGKRGQQWLRNLPELIHFFEKLWNFRSKDCFSNVTFNYVAPVIFENGQEAVLKCGVPSIEQSQEIAALNHYNGVGAVRVLKFSEQEGGFLMERILPGIRLEEIENEEQAAVQAIELIRKLHRPIKETESFATLAEWFSGLERLTTHFGGGSGPFSKNLINKAKSISHELLNSMSELVLLHGDLHYANIILSEQNNWVAIDPKGVIGEQEFEIPFPRFTEKIDKKLLQQRLDRFIEFSGFDRQRVIGWLFARSVLAGWWMYEDFGRAENKFIHCAEALESMLSTS